MADIKGSSSPPPNTTDWQTQAAKKREQCLNLIPPSWRLDASLLDTLRTPLQDHANNVIQLPRICGILSVEELHITDDYDVPTLLSALASGKLSSVAVTTAFAKRAAIAQQVTNCITEIYFEDAVKRAKELDEMRENGQLAGPFHGLPISLKDSFQVAGSQSTLGLVAFLNDTSELNSALVEMLSDLGAVIYCKTNIPQTLMSADTHNNVFGRTLNPFNTAVGAGGSSGGEGALVAMRGSPLGVGTDIGGSIRIPAHCCGTYGFRPTAGRVPYGGQKSCSDEGIGLAGILACAGPLSNDIYSLEIFMKAVVGARPHMYDVTAINVPWRDVASDFAGKKLRLGFLAEEPSYPLHPPMRKSLADAARLLHAAGHDIIYLSAEECRTAHALQVAWSYFGLQTRAAQLVDEAGEGVIPSRLIMQERWTKVNQSFVADLPANGLERLAALNIKRKQIADTWRKLWVKYQLDAVIGPTAQNTALTHDEFGLPPYTLSLNLLDYPACVIPYGKADASTATEIFHVKPGQSASQYHPDNIRGAPCSIQVFTSTMLDEECLQVAKIVDSCLMASLSLGSC